VVNEHSVPRGFEMGLGTLGSPIKLLDVIVETFGTRISLQWLYPIGKWTGARTIPFTSGKAKGDRVL